MKTSILKMAKALFFATMTLMLANCSKDSSSSTSPYVYTNGICYSGTVQVATSYCTSSTQYQWLNGQCYDTINRVYTTNTVLCQQSSTNMCNGTYYYNQGYGVQTITCSSSSTNYYTSSYQSGYNMVYNCRGLSLYQLVTVGAQQQYQQINCQ